MNEEISKSYSEIFNQFNNPNVKRITNYNDSKVLHITLEPGECLDKFSTKGKTVFYVHEGKGILILNDCQQRIEMGKFLDCTSNTTCGFYNDGKCLLSFFIIRMPE